MSTQDIQDKEGDSTAVRNHKTLRIDNFSKWLDLLKNSADGKTRLALLEVEQGEPFKLAMPQDPYFKQVVDGDGNKLVDPETGEP